MPNIAKLNNRIVDGSGTAVILIFTLKELISRSTVVNPEQPLATPAAAQAASLSIPKPSTISSML